MNLNELKSEVSGRFQGFRELTAQLAKEYSASENKIAFVKTAFNREILEKKERIPGALITAWLLILLVISYDWTYGMSWATVFNLGVLPFLAFYIIRTIREAPSN